MPNVEIRESAPQDEQLRARDNVYRIDLDASETLGYVVDGVRRGGRSIAIEKLRSDRYPARLSS